MIQWRPWYGRFPWLLWLFWLLACSQLNLIGDDDAPPVVVTEVVVIEGTTQIVTRVVQQTVAVTATPDPNGMAVPAEPIELDISYVGSPPNIDPQKTASDAGIDLMENLFAGLTNYNHIRNIVEPELALSWDVSRDARVWTFHLRDDIFWVRPAESFGETAVHPVFGRRIARGQNESQILAVGDFARVQRRRGKKVKRQEKRPKVAEPAGPLRS